MAKIIFRKPRPSPPPYYWWDTDNCWCCPNPNSCSNCKFMKKYMACHKKNRKLERDFRRFYELDEYKPLNLPKMRRLSKIY